MDHSIALARHFARLLWLLLHQPENIDEQKASLRALVTVSRDGPVTLALHGEALLANGHAVGPGSAVQDAAARLAAHGVQAVVMHAAAAPADLLQAARLLAAAPSPSRASDEALRDAGATSVHLVPAPRDVRSGLFDHLEIVPDPDVDIPAEPRPDDGPAPRAVDPRGGAGMYRPGGSLFDHFAAASETPPWEALLLALRQQPDHALAGTLAALTQEMERARRSGDVPAQLAIAIAMIDREARTGDAVRRELGLVLRRMLDVHTLRQVAGLVPRRAAAREDVIRVLMRAGDDGADAVIELLAQAPTATDRRAYFDVLRVLRSGVPTLLHMLGDDRWYVVRNAVELLGELAPLEAEKPILALLQHPDGRVRQSVTVALMRMDTPAARAAVLSAVRSDSPEQRQQAVAALGERRDANTASMLLRAFEHESDEGVQQAILAALGRVASDDAVRRLIEAAEPPGGFFRRKSPALRAAAALALGEARTAAAVDALRRLVDDREREVRDAALRALANVRRGNEPRVTGVFEAVKE